MTERCCESSQIRQTALKAFIEDQTFALQEGTTVNKDGGAHKMSMWNIIYYKK